MSADLEQPVLCFDSVTVRFGDAVALRRVSFEIQRGESVVILGEAGSGKTVILKSALGLQSIDEGNIRVFNQDVTGYSEQQWFDVRSRIGVLFQEGGLFDSFTIEDNVAYPLRNQKLLRCSAQEVQRRVEEALSFVELSHTLAKFPSELSGGMRRRVGIARAVITQPELLLYDSPTAGLDPITANTIIELIVKGRDTRNATTLIVTHRAQDGEIMDGYHWDAASNRLLPVNGTGRKTRTRYLVMRKGELVFDGALSQLVDADDAYLRRFVRQAA